ncbi:MAG: AraC family transcriptional regulator [Pseudomonadota bacterium]
MEIIENAGFRVFLEAGTLAQERSWNSVSEPGYWIGVLLSGEVKVQQSGMLGGCLSGGAGTMFHSDRLIETRHTILAPGPCAAVFVQVHSDSAPGILGEDALEMFGDGRIMSPAVAKTIGWQMLGCDLWGASRRLYLAGKGLELAAHVLADLPSMPSGPQAFASRDIEAFHEARAILMRELSDPPSVGDLARRLGLNATKLNAGFRELFGQPPYAFSKSYRLERAKHLFEAGETSVTRVARQLGYQPRHLTTEFRRKYGVTPREIIRAH